MVQLLFRAGASSKTVALVCEPSDDVLSVKHALSGLAKRLVGAPDDMVLVHEGRVLQDGTQLASYPSLLPPPQQQLQQQGEGAQGASTSSGPAVVHVLNRLRGGGGDGGSTGAESRSCYLEMYAGKKADKVNPLESLIARWTRCQLSGAELSPPCVVDELGCLYNKDALLAALLAKSVPPHLSYITGLKSVTELKLTRKQKAAGAKGGNGGNGGGSGAPTAAVKGLHNPGNEAEFCCPITDLEFNGRFKFVVHRPTGYAVSEKATKELPLVVEELVGSKPTADDWIPINPSGEQLEALKVKVAAKLAADREKKAKKAAAKQQQQQPPVATATTNGSAAAAPDAPAANGKHREASPGLGNGEASNGKLVGQKREGSGSPAPAAAPAAGLPPAAKKAKAAPALAAMPKHATSSVYASLFTSSLPEGADKETYLCRNTSARGVHLT